MSTSPVGEYLRARRGLVHPADVGIPAGPRRRVAGLRRAEVAMLAGISTEYYVRLEQGKGHQPSPSVINGLAAALRLDRDAHAYLAELAQAVGTSTYPAAEAIGADQGAVRPQVQRLIGSWPLTPAYVQSRSMTTLAANPLALSLWGEFRPGGCALKATFLDPSARDFYRDWEAATAVMVPFLRAEIGTHAQDRHVRELVDELLTGSERFRTLWGRQDVKHLSHGLLAVQHEVVGPIDLEFERLHLPADGQVIVAYHAESGSPSEDRLRELGSASLQGR